MAQSFKVGRESLNYDAKACNCNEEALKETQMHSRHGKIIKVRRGALKGDVQVLKDYEEALKGNRESQRAVKLC